MKNRRPTLNVLPTIEIAKPCPLKDFSKDFQCRGVHNFCTLCKENVYTLSEMSEEEICHLVEKTNGSFCASLEHHPDGSLVTKNSRAKLLPQASALMASSILLASSAFADREISPRPQILRGGIQATPGKVAVTPQSASSPQGSPTPSPTPQEPAQVLKGKVAIHRK